MATSGSFDTEHRVSGSYNTYGHFEWSQESQSVERNETKINFTFKGRTAGPNQWVYTYGASVTVDGQYFGAWEGKMYNDTTMISNSKTIGHSADGSRQFSASGSLSMVESNNYKSGSNSWWLNTIPRQANITSAPDFNDEANPTINYENKAGNSVTSLQACISLTGATDDIAYRDIPKTGTSYTFNLTNAERNVLRNATTTSNSRNVTFYVRTIIGSNTFHSTSTKTFSIVNANPTFTNFAYADTNSTTTAITGNNQYIIQNKSTLRATISSSNKAVANKGASMSNYTFAISSYSGSANYSTSDINKDIGTINATSNQTLTITAKDSRGNTKAVSKTVNIVPYASPSIVPTVTRANNFEAATTIAVSGAMSLLSVAGVTKNAVNSTNGIQYRYKDASSSTWGSWNNITSTTAADGKVSTSSFILTLDNTKAFNFEFKITDKLETKTISYTLSQGQPQFFIGSDGRVAVGGTPSYSLGANDTGLLDVKGKIYASTNIYAGQDVIRNGISLLDRNQGSMYTFNKTIGSGDNLNGYHTNAGTYRVTGATVPFNTQWWGTLVCVGDQYYMQQIAICNYTIMTPTTRIAVRTWVSDNGSTGNWSGWTYTRVHQQTQDWEYLGGAENTSAVTNGRVVNVAIPSEWQNCSLKVMAKLELSSAGWVDLRTYNSNGNQNKHTVNTVYSRQGVGGGEGYTNTAYLAAVNEGTAYRCHMFQATSMRSDNGNWRSWISEAGDGYIMNQTSALQQDGYNVGSVSLWTGGTAQTKCCIKVWGMKP